MPNFSTVNPRNDDILGTYEYMSERAAQAAVAQAFATFAQWRTEPLARRTACLHRLAELLTERAAELAALATDEMGKPLAQSVKEVEKCAFTCRHYAAHAEEMLRDEIVAGGPAKSRITFQPLGPVLAIMPWNFPYWQVIRAAAPALAAGNVLLLKHADNSTGVALALAELMLAAGFPAGAFTTLLLNHERIAAVIAAPEVRAVTLTGSERAGAAVAAQAGTALKKTVMELGGSDAYVVLRDADLEKAAAICVEARLVNSGQSCVAAKRFIVEAPVYDRFVEAFTVKARAKKVGDPRDSRTDVGPLAKKSILEGVAAQVQSSLKQGAKALLGGTRPGGPGCFYPVTVLTDVQPGMAAFDEEVFGPVAAIVRAADEQEALELANRSRFGLGGAIFSRNVERAEKLAAERLECGFAVVNGMVASDPRLPFGGIKHSGYGRELSRFGLLEFVNVKTVIANA